jgi:hypothetical protein
MLPPAMIVGREAFVVSALAAALLAAGCGGGDGGGKSSTAGRPSKGVTDGASTAKTDTAKTDTTKTDTTKTVPAAPLNGSGPKDLPRPVYARCGTTGLMRSVNRLPVPGRRSKVWRVSYSIPGGPQVSPKSGETSTIIILEQVPGAKAAPVKNGRAVTVAGRRVTLASIQGVQWVAQWKTGRALYSVVTDGVRQTAIRRIIGCLP